MNAIKYWKESFHNSRFRPRIWIISAKVMTTRFDLEPTNSNEYDNGFYVMEHAGRCYRSDYYHSKDIILMRNTRLFIHDLHPVEDSTCVLREEGKTYEVYEADIIRWIPPQGSLETYLYGVVEEHSGTWMVCNNYTKAQKLLDVINDKGGKVVGNIFQNKKLYLDYIKPK